MKELELEAEKYARRFDSEIKNEYDGESLSIEDKIEIEAFVAGATSKFVQKQKIEFAIEQLKLFDLELQKYGLSFETLIFNQIKNLEQKLNES